MQRKREREEKEKKERERKEKREKREILRMQKRKRMNERGGRVRREKEMVRENFVFFVCVREREREREREEASLESERGIRKDKRVRLLIFARPARFKHSGSPIEMNQNFSMNYISPFKTREGKQLDCFESANWKSDKW